MNFFFEDPWKFVIVGLLVEIALFVALFRTGRVLWLYWIAGVVVATFALVGVERWVVTDIEQIDIALHGVAAAAEKNDLNGVLEFFSPQAKDVRENLRRELPKYKVSQVSIHGDLKITVNELTSPPQGHAEFHVTVTGGIGAIDKMTVPLFFVVHYERINGRWFISGYDDPTKVLQGHGS